MVLGPPRRLVVLGGAAIIPGPHSLHAITPALLAVHALLLVQLIPLPPSLLRVISPGSFAVNYVPPLVVETWAPLTASPTGTQQAWLFFAGVHALAFAFFGSATITRTKRMALLFSGMAGIGVLMAIEGLVQAASPHPYWLYGVLPVPNAGSHERGIFGPYYNRDHYSNLIAIAASVAAGLLARRIPRTASRLSLSAVNSPDFPGTLALTGALVLMFAASAASGSRGGLAAIGVGVIVGLSSPFLARPRLALGSAVLLAVVLFGTGVPSAIGRMADVDFELSRLMVWWDTLRLIEFYPVFGCGVGAFAPAYWPYQRVVRYEYWPHAHNEYLQWLLEAGAVGIVMALNWLRAGWRSAPGWCGTRKSGPRSQVSLPRWSMPSSNAVSAFPPTRHGRPYWSPAWSRGHCAIAGTLRPRIRLSPFSLPPPDGRAAVDGQPIHRAKWRASAFERHQRERRQSRPERAGR